MYRSHHTTPHISCLFLLDAQHVNVSVLAAMWPWASVAGVVLLLMLQFMRTSKERGQGRSVDEKSSPELRPTSGDAQPAEGRIPASTPAVQRDAEVQCGLLRRHSIDKATGDDIKGLTHAEFMQLFSTLSSPALDELEGEYTGEMLAMGVLFPVAYVILHYILGHGWWLGQGFSKEGQVGYNLFWSHYQARVKRRRPFDVYFAPSAYDSRESLHMVYRARNRGLIPRVLRGELRLLNVDLLLGVASLGRGYFATPFFLHGPKAPLQRSDIVGR